MESIPVGTIFLRIEGITKEQTERYNELLSLLVMQGALNIKNGKTILSFDQDGTLQEISFDYKKWRRKR